MDFDNEAVAKKRLELIRKKMANPCPPGEHDYDDHVFTTETMGTMLHTLCRKCLDMQGWIFKD